MEIFTSYMTFNWVLILILLAFVIVLKITIFLDKKTIRRLYILAAAVFVLSIIVFIEFYLVEIGGYNTLRATIIAIRYSATPLIIAFILYTLVHRARWYVLIPAALFAVFNFISIFTGIVFSIGDDGEMLRGPLGYLPYIAAGLYCVALVYVLVRQSNKLATEIIPIAFLAFAFGSGLILPFLMGKEYSKVFCPTVAVAIFVYYVFLILQLTKKDPLTGLLNRQAYYAAIKNHKKDITGVVSIDMNGLKTINDNEGHIAGDQALITLADCFKKSISGRRLVYRIGGDEFIIVCRKTSEKELIELVDDIKTNVSETKYSCSVGYCYSSSDKETLEDMVKISDKMMYQDKAKYYKTTGIDRRKE